MLGILAWQISNSIITSPLQTYTNSSFCTVCNSSLEENTVWLCHYGKESLCASHSCHVNKYILWMWKGINGHNQRQNKVEWVGSVVPLSFTHLWGICVTLDCRRYINNFHTFFRSFQNGAITDHTWHFCLLQGETQIRVYPQSAILQPQSGMLVKSVCYQELKYLIVLIFVCLFF